MSKKVADACAAAEGAFDAYRGRGLEERANFLEAIGDEIVALGDQLIETASRETALPKARLEGERARTVGQLRMFAEFVRSAEWLRCRVEPAQPDREPTPRPELRMRMLPLGPVAVFGASNFPLAFSTAGGDTAAALAAGCPVVLKSHSAHQETSGLVGSAVERAAERTGMPAGVFTHLSAGGHGIGRALVQDPRIAAVGFTGSRAGGLALLKLAQARPVPIPLYAEMSSINPVVLLPHALRARGTQLGRAGADSITLGCGQFCTNPGLLLAIRGDGLGDFLAAARESIAGAASARMLTTDIREAYEAGVDTLASHSQVETLAIGSDDADPEASRPHLFSTSAKAFLKDKTLSAEIFGPASLFVQCEDEAELLAVLRECEGQLTITVHMDDQDIEVAARLLPLIELKAGRLVVNGWPTGVEVNSAMVHGGPFPATSDSRTTSVGTLAIERFLRPVCYQDVPRQLIPAELI